MLCLGGDVELAQLSGFGNVLGSDTLYAVSAIVNDQVFGLPPRIQLLRPSPPFHERLEVVGATQRSLLR